MEPIGQKTPITSSEETIFTSDLVIESEEKGTEKIFDSALDQILTEGTDYENTFQELLEKEGQDSLISYVHQNQFDSEIGVEPTSNDLSDYKLFPSEINRPNFSSEDSRHAESNILKKSIQIDEKLTELADPRIITKESNFVSQKESGIAETGLQTLLDETIPDNSKAVIQQFLHQVNPASNKNEIIEEGQQTALNKNFGISINSEEEIEIPRSILQKIMHKTSNQSLLSEEVVIPEESISRTGYELKSDNPKSINQPLLSEKIVISEETVSKTGDGIKSKINNNLVSQIQDQHNIEVGNKPHTEAENQKFIHKNEMQPVAFNQIGANPQGSEISGGETAKNLLTDNTISKEQLKARESLQLVENFKSYEVSQTKAVVYDTDELAADPKSKFSYGLQVFEQDKSSSETQNLKNPKILDIFEFNEGLKVKEESHSLANGKVIEDFLTKEILKNPDELNEKIKAKETFHATVAETAKGSSEKLPFTSVNHLSSLASKESKSIANSNSGVEPIIHAVISGPSETSSSSIFKTPDSMNSSLESLRNPELPFDIQQLVSRVRIIRGNGVEEMTLRLHPEELGNITLKVKQSGGDLVIDMRVENSVAKQIVESGFDTLRSRFMDQEFAYKDLALNVDINQRGSQFGSERQFKEFEDELFSSQKREEQETSTLEETPLERHRTDSGLNLYV